MNRLKLGLALLSLVAAILIVAPTVVFWHLWGVGAVMHHWAWVTYLTGLTLLGLVLVFTARGRPGQPQIATNGARRRLHWGFAACGLVAAILLLAPTLVFGQIFGPVAVLAYWASVAALGVMTLGGLFLVFTAKSPVPVRP